MYFFYSIFDFTMSVIRGLNPEPPTEKMLHQEANKFQPSLIHHGHNTEPRTSCHMANTLLLGHLGRSVTYLVWEPLILAGADLWQSLPVWLTGCLPVQEHWGQRTQGLVHPYRNTGDREHRVRFTRTGTLGKENTGSGSPVQKHW